MAFQDLIARADRFSLAQFGEPITLEFETTALTVQAVVDIQGENAEPLMPGNSRQAFSLTLTAADAADVTTEWTAVVRGRRRPVLAAIPDGAGMAALWLGDEEDPDAL